MGKTAPPDLIRLLIRDTLKTLFYQSLIFLFVFVRILCPYS